MRKTGNYGWWASGALTVALLAVPALVIWSQNAQASTGFNCGNPKYTPSRGHCNTRQIAIDTLVHYYNINKARSDRNYGCNWYRTLRAFHGDGGTGRWRRAGNESSIGLSTLNPPDMASPPPIWSERVAP